MRNASLRPQRVAMLRDCDTRDELAPLGTLEGKTGGDSADLAKRLAAKWLTENGVDRAILQVLEDGATILWEEVCR